MPRFVEYVLLNCGFLMMYCSVMFSELGY